MSYTSRRVRIASLTLTVAAALLASACADERIRDLELGMSKDSVLKVLARGGPADDSLANIYKHGRYLVEGRNFDVYLFDAKNRKVWKDPEVEDKELTPVVVVNDTLEGSGWKYMKQVQEKYRIDVLHDPRKQY